MNPELIVAIIACSLLIIGINTTECWIQYRRLIKDKKLVKSVPAWQDTKKPIIWYIVWSLILWLDLIPFLIVAILANSTELLLGAFLLTIPPFFILYLLAYFLLSNIIFKKANKK